MLNYCAGISNSSAKCVYGASALLVVATLAISIIFACNGLLGESLRGNFLGKHLVGLVGGMAILSILFAGAIYGGKKYGVQREDTTKESPSINKMQTLPEKTDLSLKDQGSKLKESSLRATEVSEDDSEPPPQLKNVDPELLALDLDTPDKYFYSVYSHGINPDDSKEWPVFDKIRDCLRTYKGEGSPSNYRFIAAKTPDGKPSKYWWFLGTHHIFQSSNSRPIVQHKNFGIYWDSRIFTKDQICWIDFDKYEQLYARETSLIKHGGDPIYFLKDLKEVLLSSN